MSNALAIAAVTTTLRNLLARSIGEELGSGIVTARPPDKARENGDSFNQVNIFLYQALPNASWRNTDLPNRVKPGETGRSPLALNLFYLLTAYGKNNEDIVSHRLLGQAMRVLHDYALLSREDVRSALAESDLHNQIERVRITLQPLNLEELSKLWATFQTQYRISVAYETSVVLIDSSIPVKTPLPVLMRGSDDQGAFVQPNLIPPIPTLKEILPPNQQPSLQLGDRLILRGHSLESESQALVRFSHPNRAEPLTLTPLSGSSSTELVVALPEDSSDWPAGFYTVQVQVQQNGQTRFSNSLAVALSPRIQRVEVNLFGNSQGTLTVFCSPPIWPEQRVSLLLGDRELTPVTDPETPRPTEKIDQLQFSTANFAGGEYLMRLRVDGVDSILINYTTPTPTFNPSQRVRLP